MTNLLDKRVKEIGKIEQFERQIRICRRLDLRRVGPVYKSWKPQTRVKATHSNNLRRVSTIDVLKQIIPFIDLYRMVSVRQIHYGMVSKQVVLNNRYEYNRVVRIVKRARLAGLISFDNVIDDTREAEKIPSWKSIEEIMERAVDQYRSDWWVDQKHYVEVWLEKRALRRIFKPITNAYDVHLCIGGGYQSWSEVWVAKKRFETRNQKRVILYFGDLDPSGKDMPRDLRERFETLGIEVTIEEIALTREDIGQYHLPRNPTKGADTRERWYIQKYGIDYSVELDALPPDVLRKKIEEAILNHVDLKLLLEKREQDEQEKEKMRKLLRMD